MKKKMPKTPLKLATETLKQLASDEFQKIVGGQYSGTPTVSSYNPTCRY
jgi:hypothetical protein